MGNGMNAGVDPSVLTTIVSNINDLYSNLVSYTVGLILFAGAFIPSVISFFQRRQLTREHADLSNQLMRELEKRIGEAEQNLKAVILANQKEEIEKVHDAVAETRTNFEKQIGLAKAGLYHIQANNENYPFLSLQSCSIALPLYLDGEDERNARSILHIACTSMKSIKKDQLDEPEYEVESSVEKIIETLGKYNTNGRYVHDIREIKRLLHKVKKLDVAAE